MRIDKCDAVFEAYSGLNIPAITHGNTGSNSYVECQANKLFLPQILPKFKFF
jgi:hypothetical protein